MRRRPLFLVIAVFFIVSYTVSVATIEALAQDDAPFEDLKDKYPLGSIHLTHVAISNMKERFRDEEWFEEVSGGNGNHIVYDLDAVFAKNTNIALHIDLHDVTAGYIEKANINGTITQIPWNRQQIREAAKWIDKYLAAGQRTEALLAMMGNNSIPVLEAAEQWSELQGTNLVSIEQAIEVGEGFRRLIGARPDELEMLESENPELYEEIRDFKEAYDQSIYGPIPLDPLDRYSEDDLFEQYRDPYQPYLEGIEHLNAQLRFLRLIEETRTNNIPLTRASAEIRNLQDTYFLTDEQAKQLGEAFRHLIDSRPAELEELRQGTDAQKELYKEIDKFIEDYDQSLTDPIPWGTLEKPSGDNLEFYDDSGGFQYDINAQFEEYIRLIDKALINQLRQSP